MISLRLKGGVRLRAILLVLFAMAGLVSGVLVGVNSVDVQAAHCNETYYGVPYNQHTFFTRECPDVDADFPNTGAPFVSTVDGDGDSVGYVIPRTSKDFSEDSEALAGIRRNSNGTYNKLDFYNRLRFHYFDRTDSIEKNKQWAKDGAAFTVFSLIGKTNPSTRKLATADWTELLQRLNNPDLVMTLDTKYPLGTNSAAVYDKNGVLDFAHFTGGSGTGPTFVFKENNNFVGSIERKCANLMGRFALPEANEWTIDGQSYVDNTADKIGRRQGERGVLARPGEALEWDHTLQNESDDDMERDITYNINRAGFTNGWDDKTAPRDTARGTAKEVFVKLIGPNFTDSRYVVKSSDGGRKLCQYIIWNDGAWNNPNPLPSARACAVVEFNYNLIPSVSGPSGFGTVGGSIDVTPRVKNALAVNPSTTTDSPPVDWQLTRIEVAPGKSIPKTQQQNGTVPCTHYANDCSVRASGNRTFPAGAITFNALTNEPIPVDAPIGTQICYALSVRPYSQASDTDWRHSPATCVKVSKQPKMQVWGHDVRTRGDIEAWSTKVNSGGVEKLFGSWVEYGGFSVGGSNGFASGSGLNTGNTATDSTDPSNVWNKLTFANLDNTGSVSYGRFTLPSNLPTITDQFIGAPSGDPISSNLGSLKSGRYVVTGDFTINTSSVGQTDGIGKSIIIVASGVLTIDGNITYEGAGGSDTFTDIRQIPQVVIIAPTINIKGNVSQIDAWLLTTTPTGMINTCSDVPLGDKLKSGVCGTVLTVNGPVVTPHLHLRRTGGSDTVATAGDPAEIFNLRPDAFVWAYGRSSQTGKAQTVYSVELPPRF